MSPSKQRVVSNFLLDALPAEERRRMQAAGESVTVALADLIGAPGQPLAHAYFPTSSFISLIMPVDAGAALEVGLIGTEGMFGLPLALGVRHSPMRAVVQGAGDAWRFDASCFQRELLRNTMLRTLIHRYACVQVAQLAQTAACTRFHQIEERLARWLLMTQDRAHASRFRVTQEFLAMMLGVRRVGVTKAASALQRRGLIEYARGDLAVLDRRGLKSAACSCYAADRDYYTRVMRRAA